MKGNYVKCISLSELVKLKLDPYHAICQVCNKRMRIRLFFPRQSKELCVNGKYIFENIGFNLHFWLCMDCKKNGAIQQYLAKNIINS